MLQHKPVSGGSTAQTQETHAFGFTLGTLDQPRPSLKGGDIHNNVDAQPNQIPAAAAERQRWQQWRRQRAQHPRRLLQVPVTAAIACVNTSMQFIAPDVVLLDPWAAVAAEFSDVSPRRSDFSLPLPYQPSKTDVNDSRSAPPGAGDAPASGGGGTASAAASGELASQQPAGSGSSKQGKKRKQSGSYQPNARELEAAARHAAIAPQLTAAVAAVQEWLRASGAPTVQQALQAGNTVPAIHRAGAACATHVQAVQRAGLEAAVGVGEAAAAAAEAAGGRETAAAGAEAENGAAVAPALCAAAQPVAGDAAIKPSGSGDAAADAAAEPDYRAMFELRFTLKPKLQFAAGMSEAAGAAAGAVALLAQVQQADTKGAAGHPQDVLQQQQQPPQQPPPQLSVNLFNRLISSAEGLGDNRSSGCSSRATVGGGTGSASGSSSSGGRSGRKLCERLAWAGGHPVVLPLRSRFLMSDARQLAPLVADAQESGGYHCIVLDPPWENASAKRSARYPTLPSRNLLGLPLRQLACPSGCLLALWITNRERHRRFIDSELLPAWGLRHLATWHWLKVTDRGQLVSRLDIEHRRPYESLLLCWPAHLPPPPCLPTSVQQPQQLAPAAAGATAAGAAAGPTARCSQAQARVASGATAGAAEGRACPSSGGSPITAASGFHLLQDRPLVIAAVPPAAHSRKPHLGPLLLPLLPPNARCLEMFARELHSGWTSWGNEALKFQSASCFEAAQHA